jgi:hypothetical protein
MFSLEDVKNPKGQSGNLDDAADAWSAYIDAKVWASAFERPFSAMEGIFAEKARLLVMRENRADEIEFENDPVEMELVEGRFAVHAKTTERAEEVIAKLERAMTDYFLTINVLIGDIYVNMDIGREDMSQEKLVEEFETEMEAVEKVALKDAKEVGDLIVVGFKRMLRQDTYEQLLSSGIFLRDEINTRTKAFAKTLDDGRATAKAAPAERDASQVRQKVAQ